MNYQSSLNYFRFIRKRRSNGSSTTSKQTLVTRYFSPTKKTHPKATATELEMEVEEDIAIDDLEITFTYTTAVENTTNWEKPTAQEKSKEKWSSLMEKMRGTPANVTLEMPFKNPETSVAKLDRKQTKSCPFYKRIPDTRFVVDAFCYGPIENVTCYFLSHYHYDHYRGLGKWIDYPVYCSQITANLVQLKIKLKPGLVRVLPLNESRIIENVEVVLLDANHCPGAVMFLFRFPTGKSILHVGDFRADPSMETWKELNRRPIDCLYLDTTYCDPRYNLPTQKEVNRLFIFT